MLYFVLVFSVPFQFFKSYFRISWVPKEVIFENFGEGLLTFGFVLLERSYVESVF